MTRKSLYALITSGTLLFGAALVPAFAQQTTPTPVPTVSTTTTPVPTVSATTTPVPATARLEVYGAIEQITATEITVNGQTYPLVDVYTDDDVRLVVGEVVELTLVQRSGAWVLVEIDDVDGDDDDRTQSELNGVIESINGTTIVVSGMTIDISSAVIEDALAVGIPVEVYLTRGANGQWVATRIERDDDDRSYDDDRGERGDDDDDRDGRGSNNGDRDDGRGNGGDDDS
ncbi:MAG: DUF5666 domain-containing protein, partial [Chloroflexota bacterium]|nr:DUF5666 domain-containing protein [Chloroflexota bacterium]